MKIYDINHFEKLNINPISLKDLSKTNVDHFIYIDPKTMNWFDLKPGYIVKTNNYLSEVEHSHWIYMYVDQLKTIFEDYYLKEVPALVQPNKDSVTDAIYLTIDNYLRTWPKSDSNYYTITDVWSSDLDTSHIKSGNDLIHFFDQYNIDNL